MMLLSNFFHLNQCENYININAILKIRVKNKLLTDIIHKRERKT